jgi:hypothetical protein
MASFQLPVHPPLGAKLVRTYVLKLPLFPNGGLKPEVTGSCVGFVLPGTYPHDAQLDFRIDLPGVIAQWLESKWQVRPLLRYVS